MLERVRTLKTKIPVNRLPECFKQLAVLSNSELDKNINELERLIKDPKFQVASNLPYKLTAFQKLIYDIDYLENYIIASLHRCSQEDATLSALIQKICTEINYPLLAPVASRLSQSYYCIDTKFNHLRVPLLESEFLLHMPDLYHELAHSLISTKNHPSIAPFQKNLGQFNLFTSQYFDNEIKILKRNNGIEQVERMEIFRESWIEGWSIEFFCDLFGVYTLGPAYGWAHLHLCVKRGIDPFETPEFFVSSHPADHARMNVILLGLCLLGFKNEHKTIESYWNKYTQLNSSKIDAYFKMSFPQRILEHCATMAFEGVKAINCNLAKPNSNNEVYSLLNSAWIKFINDPNEYINWERLQRFHYDV